MTWPETSPFRCGSNRRMKEPELQHLVLARLAEVGLPESVVVKSRRSFRAACASGRPGPGPDF